MEELLAANRSLVSAVSPDGWTPLHLAAFFGAADAARALLNKGASPSARSTNAMQNLPLHAAAAGRHAAIVAAADRAWIARRRPPARRLDRSACRGAERRHRHGRDSGFRRRRRLRASREQPVRAGSRAHQGPAADGRIFGSARGETVSDDLNELHRAAVAQLEAASTLEAIEAVRVEVLGPQGQARPGQQGVRQALAGRARAQRKAAQRIQTGVRNAVRAAQGSL